MTVVFLAHSIELLENESSSSWTAFAFLIFLTSFTVELPFAEDRFSIAVTAINAIRFVVGYESALNGSLTSFRGMAMCFRVQMLRF